MASHTVTFLLCLSIRLLQSQLICEDGYTCYEDSVRNVVWVKLDAGNIYGPNCQRVCEGALENNAGVYHSCDRTQAAIYDVDSFSDIATGLGFSCKSGGCWDNISPGGDIILVTRGNSTSKRCYFPSQIENTDKLLSCEDSPGNGNCFSERFSTICPCIQKPLDEACIWTNPANVPSIAKWGDDEGTSCIDRVNYWRKVACDEGWIECPPSGLPPMTECTCCHECANSQSEYDKSNGAHSSFKRCGDSSQGQGGGNNCAAVIDAFVSERAADENGTVRCQGHCGPIVKRGCQTFFWGRYENFHTLNWRSCNTEKCNEYCNDPTDNACFSSPDDIEPNLSQCDNVAFTEDDDMTGTVVGVSLFLFIMFFVAGLLFWKRYNVKNKDNLKTNVNKSINDKKINKKKRNTNGNTV